MPVQVTQDKVEEVLKVVRTMDRERVMVGFPQGSGPRRGKAKINNASLAYIHEHGAPRANIPARPFLNPGVRDAEPQIDRIFRAGAIAALNSKQPASGVGRLVLNQVGVAAVSAVQRKMTTGPFAPLKPATIKRKKSSRPLIDTGQLRASVTWVVRPK
jgi:hypothetical protein